MTDPCLVQEELSARNSERLMPFIMHQIPPSSDNDTPQQLRTKKSDPRHVAWHTFKGILCLIFSRQIHCKPLWPFAIVYFCIFTSYVAGVLEGLYTQLYQPQEADCQCESCIPILNRIQQLTPQFIQCYAIQMWQKQSNLTYDNILLGQYVAFWVIF